MRLRINAFSGNKGYSVKKSSERHFTPVSFVFENIAGGEIFSLTFSLSFNSFLFFSFCTVWGKTNGNHRKHRREADRERERIQTGQRIFSFNENINSLKMFFFFEKKGKRKRV